jgi:hypothetical protein
MTSVLGSTVAPAILYPISVNAQDELAAPGLPVADEGARVGILKQILTWLGIDAKNDAKKAAEDTLKNTVHIALKQGLNNLLNTIAYDTATWLASGGEGQQPMFYTEGWGEYLTNLADGAAGDFIQKIGEDWAGFNVCDPSDLSVKLSIGLSLAQVNRPRAPECSITQMVNNWGELVNDENFLNRFTASFDPTKNDVGIAVTVMGKYFDSQSQAREAGAEDRKEGEGFKE